MLRCLRSELHRVGMDSHEGLADAVRQRDNTLWAKVAEIVDALKHGCVWVDVPSPVPAGHPAQIYAQARRGTRCCVHALPVDECGQGCVLLRDRGVDSFMFGPDGRCTRAVQTKNYARGAVFGGYKELATFSVTGRRFGAAQKILSLTEDVRCSKECAAAAADEHLTMAVLTDAEIVEACTAALGAGLAQALELYPHDDWVPVAPADEGPAMDAYTLRPMQARMHKIIRDGGFRGRYRFQVPCGAGKTSYAGWLCAEIRRAHPGARFVFLVPTRALADRTAPTFARWGLPVCRVHCGAGHSPADIAAAAVVVAVYNSVEDVRPHGPYFATFIDEAHHTELPPRSQSYIAGCRTLAGAARLQVELSATFSDPAGCALVVPYEEAVAAAICVDIRVVIPLYNGENSPLARMTALAMHVAANPAIYRKILAYCNRSMHARTFAALVRQHDPAIVVHIVLTGTPMQDRQRILAALAGDPGRVMVVSVQTLCEGVDVPAADTCMFLGARRGSSGIMQPIGRVVRAVGTKTVAHVILPTSDGLAALKQFTAVLADKVPALRAALCHGADNPWAVDMIMVGDRVPATEAVLRDALRVELMDTWWRLADGLEKFIRAGGIRPGPATVFAGQPVGAWFWAQCPNTDHGPLSDAQVARVIALNGLADRGRAIGPRASPVPAAVAGPAAIPPRPEKKYLCVVL